MPILNWRRICSYVAVVCGTAGPVWADPGHDAFVVGVGDGLVMSQLGHTAFEKVSADASDAAYYVFSLISPPGFGIPPHIHTAEDEIIYVASGDYEIILGSESLQAGPGSILNFARGTAHGFANVGNTSGETIWTVTPGGNFQAFFHELAAFPPGPPDPAVLGELFGRYGIELLPPPG